METPILPVRHESASQPGLFFWAESVARSGNECWVVTSQADGFPMTEAFDDWFAYFKDADEIAQMLARGEDVT